MLFARRFILVAVASLALINLSDLIYLDGLSGYLMAALMAVYLLGDTVRRSHSPRSSISVRRKPHGDRNPKGAPRHSSRR